MAQFNFYVHGVPIGHEVCPRDNEEDYLKDFYSHDKEIKETSYMQIDIVSGNSFYTYLHKKNVSSEIGRPGSYLGLTVCFSKQYCTNVHMLYEILETIYQKICIGCLIKQDSGNERFLVKEIASAQFKGNLAVDHIKAVFKQSLEKYLANSFEDMEGYSSSVGEVRFSLKEVDSPLFKETLKTRRILVSSEYETVNAAFKNLLKEMKPLKEEYERYQNDNKQLQENNKSLTEEVARLTKELSSAEVSAEKKYKNKIDEVQAKCVEIEKEKKHLEENFREAASAVGLIDAPVKTLTRLLASRFPEECKKGYKKDSEYHSSKRNENQFKSWLPMVNFVLLLCILAFCGYCCYSFSKLSEHFAIAQKAVQAEVVKEEIDKGTTMDGITVQDDKNGGDQESTGSTGTEGTPITTVTTDIPTTPVVKTSFDDFSNCLISISPYDGRGNLKKGKAYTLSVKKKDYTMANVPSGKWIATKGITISGNSFTVDATIVQQTNVLIHYTVNGQNELSRTIRVE